ncbi:sulfatase-like hydrolase/transferase [Hyalangium versicolor]|uniref:sulfatase-like hydrolase/transferase n=1 Tax=Hyalangium versicolor TaxID=2861190 RepID=UPI001CCDF7FF|nr:sulfatase-like hydrolase/transferase [Hyalangium versicolor]
MSGLAQLCATWLELTLAGAVCAALIKAVKYRGFSVDAAIDLDDLAWVALIEFVLVLPASLGPAGAVVGLLGGGVFYFALWLDAVLFRIFTIELGPGGVGSVILSVLYRELAELSFARRFFSSHRLFAALPAAATVAHGWLFLGAGSLVRAGLILGLCVYLVAATWVCTVARARLRALGACGALLLVGAGMLLVPGAAMPAAGAALGLITIARALQAWRGRASGPSGVRHFLFERLRPKRAGFRARPEHARVLESPPRPLRPSNTHGLLRGQDVVLFTFESVGRVHLAATAPSGAHASFFQGLMSRSLRSRHHACLSPTTNNAHTALYASSYTEAARFSSLRALSEAGYQTVYLTTARTGDYGLRAILDKAGFQHIIDRALLAPEQKGLLTDQVLLSQGLEQLSQVLRAGSGPLFLHVHATHTHVPYRVIDAERFRRFDSQEDYGRFLNAIEEEDALFGALLEGLRRQGLVKEPLVVVSSDHGQAFGRLGYHSHGSAITRDELDVPLLFHHPALAPREVPFSSHFDVLPTVLDLLGVAHGEPVFGDSLLHDDRRPELLVWAGHPSRSSTSHYGLLLQDEKLMVDLVLDRCLRMDWNDEHVEELTGEEKSYAVELASHLMNLRGVT